MARGVALAAVVLVVAGVAGLVWAAPAGGPLPSAVGDTPGFDTTTFEIRVYENGSARWTFEHARPLDNDTQLRRYRGFVAEFNDTHPVVRNFKRRARGLVAAGQNATGRTMRARDFESRAYVNDLETFGLLELSFLWTNFSRETADGLVVGDVFEGGLYLASDWRLVVVAGPNLTFAAVEPRPDVTSGETLAASDSVTWRGKQVFSDNHPRIEFTLTTAVGSTTTSTTATTGAAAQTPAASPSPAETLLVGVLVVAIGLGGAALWRSRKDEPNATTPRSTPTASSTDPETADAEIPDEELLSDTDRVVQMLEANGGRMKQVDIVDETDWSKSKVSMLLSDMEDEGTISKLRVGRENIISLEGHEPEATDSPFPEQTDE